MKNTPKKRLLVFNCHEAWIYQLSALDYDLDIIVGLKGHHTTAWDIHVRPIPPNARLISLKQALANQEAYTCIIAHNPTDLLDCRARAEPCILILHLPVEARLVLEKSHLTAFQARSILRQYAQLCRVHVVAVSRLKGESWGYKREFIPFGIDPEEYPSHTGMEARGLRIANFIQKRKQFLNWEFHTQAFHDLPVTLIGHNPEMKGINPSRDWDHLKKLLQTHRFYIHTADQTLEDGYNMATIEAMAAGLPVLGNPHPSSPIVHGVNGFLSDDPQRLHTYALQLLTDPALALRMGQAAQATVRQHFSPAQFQRNMERAIKMAQIKRGIMGAVDTTHLDSSAKPRSESPSIMDISRHVRKGQIRKRKVIGV